MSKVLPIIFRALCCGLLLTSSGIVAQNRNNLVVFSETGDRFYLILNGLKYNEKPETNVKVTNLNAANYKAKILFEHGQPDLSSNVYLMWEGNEVTNKEFTYAVSKKGDKYKLKFISQADMSGVNPNSSNSVVYNSNGTLNGTSTSTGVNSNSTQVSTGVSGGGMNSTTTVTSTTTTTGSGNANGSVGMNVNVDGINMSINVIGTPTAAVLNTNTVTTTTTTYSTSSTSSNTGGGTAQTSNNTSSVGGCSGAMSADDFDDLKKSIEGKSFEDVKMTVLKQAVAANCVNTGQVRKLMDLFSFEANKLDVTKYCYDFTTDKKNYYKVNDGFTFSGSVEELNTYIKGKK